MWKRTGNNEYPEQGQDCLIYFQETGFSFSTFEKGITWVNGNGEETKDPDGTQFFDDDGYLTDEDLLWIPKNEIPQWSFSHLKRSLPEEYVNDKKFKKWDDPEKVYRYVELKEDYHYIRNPEKKSYLNHFKLDIPKGSKVGITSNKAWKNDGSMGEGDYVWQCVYDSPNGKTIVYLSEDTFKEIA
jgi:hypothetical protein